ncbi:hypothetical protein [Clostridium cylindrosporum]|uniref:Uncharacterized protein n=1 Tax=Clostridium cylindrosporum DSM 605 TaxID=1121307 RepID=A0A0J8G244_CLOCY|nr:hypothetical protein [Clostridium cylindrosporum]KMT21826.1 hypothetical protein CLCY_3c00970 [Clostridium cylindrosporum DSM 605]
MVNSIKDYFKNLDTKNSRYVVYTLGAIILFAFSYFVSKELLTYALL